METKLCKACQMEIPAESPFCHYCGTAQQEEKPMESVQTPRRPEPVQTAPRNETMPIMEQNMPRLLPRIKGETGCGKGWIVFLRVLLWIFFTLMMLATIASAVRMFAEGDEEMTLIALGVFIGGIFLSFLTVAGGMISLNNAENHLRTANNTAKIISLLQQK